MSWAVLLLVGLGLALAVAALALRRAELARMQRERGERGDARARGSHEARLQHPFVDLTQCIGCGLCVRACPEDGVLGLDHGQAIVLHGARCVGHGRCADACPTGAIAVTLGDLAERRDVPALTDALESVRAPGVFLAGEVTGYALVRTAIAHGTAVAGEVARRSAGGRGGGSGAGALDLCVVGAGPAGIACALEAKRRGLDFLVLERETLGGTVAHYPRGKLVMTQPVELPLAGRLTRATYAKEELVELWERVAREHDLPIATGEELAAVERDGAGAYVVRTHRGREVRARHVCLALGRRGTPRKLGVPGEELPKVVYALLDAAAHAGRRVLVVGGGDSAVEAALGLAEQEGCEVALSYRREAFFRLKARNEARIAAAATEGRVRVLFGTAPVAIEPKCVRLSISGGGTLELPNDDVVVLAGGVPPFRLLEACGVSFDPADRPPVEPLAERGSGLLPALAAALVLALAAGAFALAHRGYYALSLADRPHHELHDALRPSGRVGLPLGIAALGAIAANLCYLARRSPRVPLRLGSLRRWMTAHVATGVLALLLATLHGAMAPRDAPGGHAWAALLLLVATGAVGRYLYAFVPRAANGRELAVEEVQARLAALSAEWEGEHRELGDDVRREVGELVRRQRLAGPLPRRIAALAGGERALRRALARWRRDARARGLSADQTDLLLDLARRAHRDSLAAARFEELRALLASWRFVHRWAVLLLLLLLALHVGTALRFGALGFATGAAGAGDAGRAGDPAGAEDSAGARDAAGARPAPSATRPPPGAGPPRPLEPPFGFASSREKPADPLERPRPACGGAR